MSIPLQQPHLMGDTYCDFAVSIHSSRVATTAILFYFFLMIGIH